jgi:putative ABC transport system permease protein
MRPPRVASALLTLLLPAALRDAILGDLGEEHDVRASARGRRAAGWWYWRQTLAIGGRILADRVSRVVRRPARHAISAAPARGDAFWRSVLTDIRYGLRHLCRNQGFAATATLVIALGIGANTAILALANAAFLQPLPYPHADRLGLLSMEFGGVNQGGFSVSHRDMEDVIGESSAFDDVGLFLDWQSVNLAGAAEPVRTPVNFVTANYFDLVGFRPALGRGFRPDEDRMGDPRSVVVLSHGVWRRVLEAREDVLGQRVLLNGLPFTVVGVLPPDASDLSHRFGYNTGIYVPLASAATLTGLDITERRSARFLYALARLRETGSMAAAQDQLAVIGRRLSEAHPETNKGWSFFLRPLRDVFFEESRTTVGMLVAGSVLMLVLVCASLMNLVLIQLAGRAAELSIRLVLGAGRLRVVRLLVTEAFCLAAIGGACGIVAAYWALGLVGNLEVFALPGFSRLEIDSTVLGGALLLVMAVGLALGLPPALRFARRATPAMHELTARHTDAGGRRRRAILVIGEVALACVLLVCAGLLIASFQRLRATGMGFDTADLLTVRLDLRDERYDEPEVVRQTAQRLLEEAGAIPSVRNAFLWSPSRLGGGNWVFFLTRPGEYDIDPLQRIEASRHHLMPQALERLGIPLRAGRDFSDADRAGMPPIAIVSESLARTFWPGQDPIGRRLETRVRRERVLLEIVGVAADARHRSRLNEPFGAQRDIYVPFQQAPERFLSILVRTTPGADIEPVASALRRRILAVDPGLPAYDMLTMEQQMWEEEARARMSTLLVAGYAVLSLVLAVLGVYGVLAHMVRQERKEIGIRLALGATAATIVRNVVWRGLGLVAIGALIGVGIAFLASRLLDSALFGIDPRDPVVFGLALVALVAPGIAACLLPARRAAAVDPIEALRH